LFEVLVMDLDFSLKHADFLFQLLTFFFDAFVLLLQPIVDKDHRLFENEIEHHGSCQLLLALVFYVSDHVVVAGYTVVEVRGAY
jgi:hypothetical protein